MEAMYNIAAMRWLSVPRLVKVVVVTMFLWWLLVRLVGLTASNPTANQQPRRVKHALSGNRTRGLVTENLAEIEHLMRSFRASDKAIIEEWDAAVDSAPVDENSIVAKFYELVARPVQGACRTLKRLGGRWLFSAGSYAAMDGDKYICMDSIRSSSGCVVYSFGVNNDWTFEEHVEHLGCEVWAYDPSHSAITQELLFKANGQRIHFEQLGVAITPEAGYDTLANIMAKNDHQHITYLKVDIEGAELDCLPQWLEDGTLEKVDQLAMEIHLAPFHKHPVRYDKFPLLLSILQDLHSLNFRLVSFEPNLISGRIGGFYPDFEVVFLKDDVWSYLDS